MRGSGQRGTRPRRLARVASIDATAPGGSGDPFAGLDAEQRAALADAYRVGFPRGAEDQIYPVSIALNGVVPGLVDFDPGYFDDFWTEPGYGGAEREPARPRASSRRTPSNGC